MYHDMGLILMTMVPFYLGAPLFLLPTRLTNIQEWLRAIEDNHGTFTAAPDFAYRFCLRHLKRPGRFDLTSLRLALNSAEPVRARTIEEFERVFGLRHVVCPGYGLAEASVGVSTWIPGKPVRVGTGDCVCVGPPFPGVELAIVDGDSTLAAGEIGEILVRSPSTTRGYYNNPDATAGLMAGNGFIKTGDLGFLDADGYLYVVARLEDMILHAGENIAPCEVEESIDELPFVRSSAAVGMAVEVVQRFHLRFGFRPGRVYLWSANGIPRTPNGKVKRSLLRERYLDGRLRNEGIILYPGY